jgi:hypothetical protein
MRSIAQRERERTEQKEGTPGFEPGTIRTAAECSTTELRTPVRALQKTRARLAQSVARGSHNPKVVSSILAPRTFFYQCHKRSQKKKLPQLGSNQRPAD